MIINENILQWIQNWYLKECNGEWEHSYGIKIETLDNPGWYVNINLQETSLGNIVYEIDYTGSDTDWYSIQVKNGEFIGNGDPLKLEILLYKFKEIAMGNAI